MTTFSQHTYWPTRSSHDLWWLRCFLWLTSRQAIGAKVHTEAIVGWLKLGARHTWTGKERKFKQCTPKPTDLSKPNTLLNNTTNTRSLQIVHIWLKFYEAGTKCAAASKLTRNLGRGLPLQQAKPRTIQKNENVIYSRKKNFPMSHTCRLKHTIRPSARPKISQIGDNVTISNIADSRWPKTVDKSYSCTREKLQKSYND